MSTMTRTEIREWVKEEFADTISRRSDELLANIDVDADDIIEIKRQRDRLLKLLVRR